MTGAYLFHISMALHGGAALLFLSGRRRWALMALLCAGIVLRYYFVTLDLFLHDWDERFHALVAKNMTQHWLAPTLVEHPILSDVHAEWTDTHIWLHKQPLFLWQMALSIQMFGATEFAVRLPGLIMTSLLILVIYQTGRALFGSTGGFIAAFIFSCHEPLLEMNSGMLSMEHNDIAFLFYVTLSIWAWVYYEQRQRTVYLLLMGLFAGCAVLCKWLTGMLVFSGFVFYHLFLARDLFTRYSLVSLARALSIAILTFLPWQLFILWHYPAEARYEYAYNSRHFYQVVEGHGHETWFYLHALPDYYRGLEYLLGAGLILAVLRARRQGLPASLAFMFVAVYVFFTLAQTKLPSYVMVVLPIGLLLIASVIDGGLRLRWYSSAWRFIAGGALFVALLVHFTHWDMIVENHFDPATWQGKTRAYKLHRVQVYKAIAGRVPAHTVLLGLDKHEDKDAMFYTGVPAYGIRSESDYRLLKDQGYQIVFWGDTLPQYAHGDSLARLVRDYLPR